MSALLMLVTQSQSCTRNLHMFRAFLYKNLASNGTQLYSMQETCRHMTKIEICDGSVFCVDCWQFVGLLFAIAFLSLNAALFVNVDWSTDYYVLHWPILQLLLKLLPCCLYQHYCLPFCYVSFLYKNLWWNAGVVICLWQGTDLHMAQMMPPLLNISCCSKSRLVLPFCYWLTHVVLDKGPLNECSSTAVVVVVVVQELHELASKFDKSFLYKKLVQVSCTRILTVCHQHYWLVAYPVCRSVCLQNVLWQSSWLDPDAVRGDESGWSGMGVLDGVHIPPRGRGGLVGFHSHWFQWCIFNRNVFDYCMKLTAFPYGQYTGYHWKRLFIGLLKK